MRFLAFSFDGRTSWGLLDGERIFDLGARGQAKDLLSFLRSDARSATPDSADFRLSDVQLETPVRGSRTFCIGFNYHAHRIELGSKTADFPTIFIRTDESVVASGAPLICPLASDNFDFEGELACVISKAGRHIARDRALEHVFGYSIFNDGSVRDFQTSSITAGKNFDGSGAFGPWIVDAEEAPGWDQMNLTTRLNGMAVQESPTDRLIFGVPDLIAYISTITTLLPGDVISTGTPGGVGWNRKPPLWMKPGDSVQVEVSGIGILANTVVAESG